jgi:hypothetical protein
LRRVALRVASLESQIRRVVGILGTLPAGKQAVKCQLQYPDLQGFFNIGFTDFQQVSDIIRQLSDLTRNAPLTTVIEQIVEEFVEGF